MRLVITGGAGFIGSATARLLHSLGHDVTVIDDLSTGRSTALGGLELIEANFTDGPLMTQLLDRLRPDAVFHFAGLKSVSESWTDSGRYHAVNVMGTESLLNAMKTAGVGRLIYSGSCAVYGNPSRLPVDEAQPAKPMNPYAESKWLAEEAIRRAHRAWGLSSCVLRYFNAAGAEPDGSHGEDLDTATNLLPQVFRVALGLEPSLPVFGSDYDTGDGTAVRDYVHVCDLATAHEQALEHVCARQGASAFNVGTGKGVSVLQVVRAAERTTGRPIPTRYEGRRSGDAPAVWADVRLASEELGWHAAYGLDDIVDSAWRWHSRSLRAPS